MANTQLVRAGSLLFSKPPSPTSSPDAAAFVISSPRVRAVRPFVDGSGKRVVFAGGRTPSPSSPPSSLRLSAPWSRGCAGRIRRPPRPGASRISCYGRLRLLLLTVPPPASPASASSAVRSET